MSTRMILALALCCAMGPDAALAQALPAPPGRSRPANDNFDPAASTVSAQTGLSRVANAAELAAWANTGVPVIRDDIGKAYTYSSAPCAIVGGDTGSQIPATGSGCWTINWLSAGNRVSPCWFASGSDDTLAIQRAINTGFTVDLSCKTSWSVTSDINRTVNGQIIEGAGKETTYVYANGASSFTKGVMVNAAGIATIDRDYTLVARQATQTSLATLQQYPPLFFVQNAGRFRMERMGCYTAITCVDARGNSGGALIADLQFSAFKYGIRLDGSADTVRINDPHWYPFFMDASGQALFFNQGSGRTIAIDSGRMDDLKVRGGLFIGGLALNLYNGTGAIAGGAGAGPTFGEFTGTDFDTSSGIAMSAGEITCGACVFTLGNAAAQAINLSGSGVLHLTGAMLGIGVTPSAPAVVVGDDGAGGTPVLTWNGGSITYQGAFDQTAVRVGAASGPIHGEAIINGVRVHDVVHGSTRSTPIIQTLSAAARLTAMGNRVSDFGTGGSGTFISIGTDGFNRIIGNASPGWLNSVGGSAMPNGAGSSGRNGVYFGN